VKIKSRPADFQVTEIRRLAIERSGPVTLYELSKRSVGTIEAVRHAAKVLGVDMKRVFFAGLKDRHAETRQYVSIVGGPPRDVIGSGYALRYVGGARKHPSRKSFLGNRFAVTVRDLSAVEAETFIERAQAVARDGVPNYFGDQRFGSLRGSGEFAAKRLILGDAEGALKCALASPSREDRSGARKVKVMLRDLWGRWDELAVRLPPRARELKIVRALARKPDDFPRAFELLERNLRVLMLHAYQSFLFNEVLARFLARELAGEFIRARYRAGTFLFPMELDDEKRKRLRELKLPLVSAKMGHSSEAGDIIEEVLAEEGVRPEMFRLDDLERTRFSSGSRSVFVVPADLKTDGPFEDELNAKRFAVSFSMQLPPGSYATVVLKRLTYDMA